jgi:hypothetical protein
MTNKYTQMDTEDLYSNLDKEEDKFYDKFHVRLEFVENCYGTIAKDPDVLEKFLSYQDQPPEIIEKELAQCIGTATDGVDKKIQELTTTFRRDSHGLYIGDFMLKANYKIGGSVLGLFVKKRGTKQIFQHAFSVVMDVTEFIEDYKSRGFDYKQKAKELEWFRLNDRYYSYKIYLQRDGKMLQEVDGYFDDMFTASTPKGSRSIIKRFETVYQAEIDFEVWVKPDIKMTLEEFRAVLILSQENGIGARRSAGGGKFRITCLEKFQSGNFKLKVKEKKNDNKGKKTGTVRKDSGNSSKKPKESVTSVRY